MPCLRKSAARRVARTRLSPRARRLPAIRRPAPSRPPVAVCPGLFARHVKPCVPRRAIAADPHGVREEDPAGAPHPWHSAKAAAQGPGTRLTQFAPAERLAPAAVTPSVAQAFDTFDKDGDGSVTEDEISKVLARVGMALSPRVARGARMTGNRHLSPDPGGGRAGGGRAKSC